MRGDICTSHARSIPVPLPSGRGQGMGRLQRRPSHPMTPGVKRERGEGEGEVSDPDVPARTRNNRPDEIGTSHEMRPATNRVEDPSSPPRCGHSPAPRRRTAVPGIVTPAWVRDAELTWSENSAKYQVKVLGEFPTLSPDTGKRATRPR